MLPPCACPIGAHGVIEVTKMSEREKTKEKKERQYKIVGDFFKRIPSIKEIKFNHNSNNAEDAYGIENGQFNEICHAARDVIIERADRQDGVCSQSQTAEDYMKHFSKEELAIIASEAIHRELNQRQQDSIMQGLVREMMAGAQDNSCNGNCHGQSQEMPDEYQDDGEADTSYYIG